MAPAASTTRSGEYPVPVTQEQFNGFVAEFRAYTQDAREWMASVNKQLSEGEATMAVLRSDSAEFRKRSDDQSSKINLLIVNDKVRAASEDRKDEEARLDAAMHAATPSAPAPVPPKPGFWSEAWDDLRKKAIGLIALALLLIIYDQFRIFVIAHPALTSDGEGFKSAPHHGERSDYPQPAPTSNPAATPPKATP
jgi:hypothetical protein